MAHLQATGHSSQPGADVPLPRKPGAPAPCARVGGAPLNVLGIQGAAALDVAQLQLHFYVRLEQLVLQGKHASTWPTYVSQNTAHRTQLVHSLKRQALATSHTQPVQPQVPGAVTLAWVLAPADKQHTPHKRKRNKSATATAAAVPWGTCRWPSPGFCAPHPGAAAGSQIAPP